MQQALKANPQLKYARGDKRGYATVGAHGGALHGGLRGGR